MKLPFRVIVCAVCAVVLAACVPGRPIQSGPASTATPGATSAINFSAGDDPESLPTFWENTEGIPPVGDQVSPGSCYAWAAGYYYLSHLQWRDYDWDVADPANQCSPAFVYNLTNGGTNEVTARGDFEREDAFRVFETMGCASMADMPFSHYDLLSLPSETAFRNGMRFRTGGTRRFDVRTDEGIARLKRHLAGGDLAVLGIFGFENLTSISSYDHTYCVGQTSGPRLFWHDVTVVGYDDGYDTADGRGAFRMVNSWGPNWGDDGYFWMSYRAVKDSKTSVGYVLFAEDRSHYEPELDLRIGLDYPDRYNLVLRAGWGGEGNGTEAAFFYYRRKFVWDGVPYPEGAVELDLTGLLDAPAGEAVLRLRFEDRLSGEAVAPGIRFLEIENRLTGRRVTVPADALSVSAASGTIDIPVPRELLAPA